MRICIIIYDLLIINLILMNKLIVSIKNIRIFLFSIFNNVENDILIFS